MKRGDGNCGTLIRYTRVNRARDMAHFDRLPPQLRQAMANAPIDYCCKGATGLVRRIGPQGAAQHYSACAAKDYREEFRREFGCDYPGDHP